LFNALPVWERAGAGAYKPGLERISAFVELLGIATQPARRPTAGGGADTDRAHESSTGHPKYVHIAGTNGKGSVSHMLAAVLQSAGYRTGLFTSPHLVDFRERIRTDGEMIPEAAVVEFTDTYRDEMVRLGLTFFEMTTALALWWFSGNARGDYAVGGRVDVAVIETGLGGRLDSTNIITPEVSVITNIGLEHTQYLGNTIEAIAAEKAGIIKPGVPVVVGEADAGSAPVFRARAAELSSELIWAGRAGSFELDLTGGYQRKNLATVLATVDVLRRGGMEITDDALREGLAHTVAMTGLRGRWQVVRRAPLVVLDTAHNAHGLAEVTRQIARERQGHDKLWMVLGFAADKDLSAIVPLLPSDAHYILTRADTPRAMRADEVAEKIGSLHTRGTSVPPTEGTPVAAKQPDIAFPKLSTAPTVSAAIERALALAGPLDMIFVGGSNFVVGEALASGYFF
jgi:dihydrofolate synthase/folylpolyglutamate synthase